MIVIPGVVYSVVTIFLDFLLQYVCKRLKCFKWLFLEVE